MLTAIAFLITTISAEAQVTGTFTDKRDGKVYKTVTIGTQTWMAQNLAYKTTGCWAYNNNDSNVATYGYLYNWETAKKVSPEGWHLPADDELVTLMTVDIFLAGNQLKEKDTTHWQTSKKDVTNETGFTALPGGARAKDGQFAAIRNIGMWWSATQDTNEAAWFIMMSNANGSVGRTSADKHSAFSIRCVKNK